MSVRAQKSLSGMRGGCAQEVIYWYSCVLFRGDLQGPRSDRVGCVFTRAKVSMMLAVAGLNGQRTRPSRGAWRGLCERSAGSKASYGWSERTAEAEWFFLRLRQTFCLPSPARIPAVSRMRVGAKTSRRR